MQPHVHAWLSHNFSHNPFFRCYFVIISFYYFAFNFHPIRMTFWMAMFHKLSQLNYFRNIILKDLKFEFFRKKVFAKKKLFFTQKLKLSKENKWLYQKSKNCLNFFWFKFWEILCQKCGRKLYCARNCKQTWFCAWSLNVTLNAKKS